MRRRRAARRQPTSTRPSRRIFDGVGDQVLQQPAQQPAVRSHRERAGDELELESLLPRQRREFDLELAQQLVDAELTISGFMAPASSREISSSAPRISSTASSEASILPTSRAVVAASLPLDQAGDVEPRRVERLQDVVAGGREEARLGDIGLLGLAFGARELGIEPGQLLGALAHPPLQRLVGALQRFGRLDARRDVGEGR